MKRWLYLLPLVALIGFGGLGLVQLFDGSKPSFTRPLRDAPDLAFAPLGGGEPIRYTDLAAEEPILVTLWASWCVPCIVEHPLLVELSADYPGRVHGLVFDDTEENAQKFLAERGHILQSLWAARCTALLLGGWRPDLVKCGERRHGVGLRKSGPLLLNRL